MGLNSPVDNGQMIVEPRSDKERDQNLFYCGCPLELNSFLLKSLSIKTICCPSSGLVFPVCPEGMPFSGGPCRRFSAQEASGACDISLRCFVRALLIGWRDTPTLLTTPPGALPPTCGPLATGHTSLLLRLVKCNEQSAMTLCLDAKLNPHPTWPPLRDRESAYCPKARQVCVFPPQHEEMLHLTVDTDGGVQ